MKPGICVTRRSKPRPKRPQQPTIRTAHKKGREKKEGTGPVRRLTRSDELLVPRVQRLYSILSQLPSLLISENERVANRESRLDLPEQHLDLSCSSVRGFERMMQCRLTFYTPAA